MKLVKEKRKEKKSNTPVKLSNNPPAVSAFTEEQPEQGHLMFESFDDSMEETESPMLLPFDRNYARLCVLVCGQRPS